MAAFLTTKPSAAREMIQVDIQLQIGTAARTAFGLLGRRCNRVVANVLRRLRDGDDDDMGRGWKLIRVIASDND